MKATTKKGILALKDNTDALAYMVQECNSWDGSLDTYELHSFEEDFFNTYFEGNPMEAARSATFGELNWGDDYIRFNGYGNVESVSNWEREDELKKGTNEIVQRFIELADEGHVDADFLLEQWGEL